MAPARQRIWLRIGCLAAVLLAGATACASSQPPPTPPPTLALRATVPVLPTAPTPAPATRPALAATPVPRPPATATLPRPAATATTRPLAAPTAKPQGALPSWFRGPGSYDTPNGITVEIYDRMTQSPGKTAEIHVRTTRTADRQFGCVFQLVDDWVHTPVMVRLPSFPCDDSYPEKDVPRTQQTQAGVAGLRWVMGEFGWTEWGQGKGGQWWNVAFSNGPPPPSGSDSSDGPPPGWNPGNSRPPIFVPPPQPPPRLG